MVDYDFFDEDWDNDESSDSIEFDADDEELDDEANSGDRRDIDDEGSYVCQSCGEDIVVPLDISQGTNQRYVEDCPVCCHPNVIEVHFDHQGNATIKSYSE